MTRRTRPTAGRERPDTEAAGGQLARERREPTPEEQREQLLMYAFRALGQRALSEAELERRMLRRNEDGDLVRSVLERVRELGYLSDLQVAQAEARRRGVGSVRVRQKLRQRGVDSLLIEEAIAERDPDAEAEDARTLLDRRWPSFQRAADPQKRAFDFLMRRGYSSGLIWPLLREKLARQELADLEVED
jgi:regulatory protein